MKEIFWGFLSSIAATGFEKFFNKIIDSNSELFQFIRKIRILILHLIITYIIFYFAKNYTNIEPLSIFDINVDYRIIFLITINIIVWLTRIKYSQINGSKYIKRKQKIDPDIEIRKLKLENNRKKVKMSWETFGKGLEELENTIAGATGCEIDAIFGVNEAGLMIAAYLSFPKRIPVGVIKTGGKNKNGGRPFLQFDFPILKERPACIAVVDSEIKSGESVKIIIDRIKNKYPKARIISIAYVGVKDSDPREVEDFGWSVSPTYRPDFLAYYVNHPGFEPPGGIR